jgi:hypothetical protein
MLILSSTWPRPRCLLCISGCVLGHGSGAHQEAGSSWCLRAEKSLGCTSPQGKDGLNCTLSLQLSWLDQHKYLVLQNHLPNLMLEFFYSLV